VYLVRIVINKIKGPALQDSEDVSYNGTESKVSRGNSEYRIILNTSPFYEQKRNYKIKFGTHKLLLLLYLYTKSWRLDFFSPGASYH